jgi:ABC-type branched-subunit amino acid transport system ATPase component
MNQGEVLMAGTPGEVRKDRRVQEIYTGSGIPPVTSGASVKAPGEAVLRFDRVNTFYGKSHILHDATLDVRQGEIVALLGRNGAGKSTLLKTLGGLFAGMTVRENLALGRLARKTDGSGGVVWSEEQILDTFPRLKERMDIAADYLSGGEQQMVAVARALSGNVKLLLLDEPFEGLAPTVILELFKVFDLLRRHTSIVIVEHNLDLVLALADRVFALERGAVFHQGPAAPLLTDLEYRKKILWL